MKISVIIAAYNGSKYITGQLNSILSQLRKEDEVIVSVDKSSDGTKSCVQEINDPRVKVVDGPSSGINMNFTHALSHATGDAILFSDQDDVWLEGRIEIFLSKLKYYNFIFFDAEVINDYDELIDASYFGKHKTNETFLGALYKCRTLGCCIGFKRSSLGNRFKFHRSYEKLPYDYAITLFALAFYDCYFTKNVYHQYRRHDQNVSRGGAKSTTSFFQKIGFRIQGLIFVIKHWWYR